METSTCVPDRSATGLDRPRQARGPDRSPGPPPLVTPGRWLPGTAGGELADKVDVLGVHQERPGQRGLATAQDVAVGLVQPQRVDGQIPLQVRLLVDRPLQLPRL